MSHQNQIGKLIQRLLRVVGANWENPLPSFNYYYINSLTVLRTCGILPPFSCPFPEAGSTLLPSRRPFWPPNRRREMETEFGGNAPNERNASAEMALPDPIPLLVSSPRTLAGMFRGLSISFK